MAIIEGLTLGVSSGLSVGPTLVLLVRETVNGSLKNGLLVAAAPLAADVPVILLALGLSVLAGGSSSVVGALSFLGAGVLAWMAWKGLKLKELPEAGAAASSFRRGIVVNLLNPGPYMFWLLVGVPMLAGRDAPTVAGFVAAFYVGLVGSKMAVAVLCSSLKARLDVARWMLALNRITALAFAVLAARMLLDGLRLMGAG